MDCAVVLLSLPSQIATYHLAGGGLSVWEPCMIDVLPLVAKVIRKSFALRGFTGAIKSFEHDEHPPFGAHAAVNAFLQILLAQRVQVNIQDCRTLKQSV